MSAFFPAQKTTPHVPGQIFVTMACFVVGFIIFEVKP